MRFCSYPIAITSLYKRRKRKEEGPSPRSTPYLLGTFKTLLVWFLSSFLLLFLSFFLPNLSFCVFPGCCVCISAHVFSLYTNDRHLLAQNQISFTRSDAIDPSSSQQPPPFLPPSFQTAAPVPLPAPAPPPPPLSWRPFHRHDGGVGSDRKDRLLLGVVEDGITGLKKEKERGGGRKRRREGRRMSWRACPR